MSANALGHSLRNLVSPLRVTPGFVVFVAGYAVILFWFKGIDIYHKEFATTGIPIAIYNVCRILYIFYLFWIVYQVGNFLLTCLIKDAWKAVGGVERIATGFFAGTGVWHVVLLLLGYLGLYKIPVAIAITVPLVAFAYRDAAASFCGARFAITGWRARGNLRVWLFRVAATTALAAAGALLLVKGLYPAGGHDYYLHYFGYFKSVIDRGGIWPTAFYTHGYDSKGDGLVFLSMLLTDPLAPQLVSFCFIATGALALHQFLSRIAPGTLWPLVAVILYLSFYIYTPGVDEFRSNGGWGDFEKWHEFKTGLTIAILWLVAGCFDAAGGLRLLRATAAGSAVVATVIIDYTFSIYLGLFFTLLAGVYFSRRRWRDGRLSIILATAAGVPLIVMLATNYIATGLLGDIGIVAWWRFTDIERLYQAGTLFQAINDYWSRTGLVPGPLADAIRRIVPSLRLELLYPLAASGVVVAGTALVIRRGCRLPQHQTIILAVAMLAYLVVALVLGRNGIQAISFYRYSSFTLPIVIAIGVTLWSFAYASAGSGLFRNAWNLFVPVAVLAGCWSEAFVVYPSVATIQAIQTYIPGYPAYPAGHFLPILVKSARFALGRSSIDEAYSNQSLWPGRLPWGGIYPGARGAYAAVGPHVRVWSFHIHAYCMLPDCRIESFFYLPMTSDDERIFFGAPEEARRDLQKAGLNYFLFSRELQINDPVLGAPLFAPSNIAKYLGVRWTDGTTTLLTWLGPNISPLSQEWLATYSQAVAHSHSVQGFYYGAMRKVFADLRARPHPWRSLDLRSPSLAEPSAPEPSSGLNIHSATYGGNCGAGQGNATRYLASSCNGKSACAYTVKVEYLGDPASGCGKDFVASYSCAPDATILRKDLPAEAGFGSVLNLSCAPASDGPVK